MGKKTTCEVFNRWMEGRLKNTNFDGKILILEVLSTNLYFQRLVALSRGNDGNNILKHIEIFTWCALYMSDFPSPLPIPVKVWTLNGGLINVFRSHSKAVTDVVLHPETSMMVLTASLDGSVKIWSLDIMELLYRSVDWFQLLKDKLEFW